MKISRNLIQRVFLLISPFLLTATLGKCLILQCGGIRVVFCLDAPPTEINAYGWGDFDDYEKSGSFWRSLSYARLKYSFNQKLEGIFRSGNMYYFY